MTIKELNDKLQVLDIDEMARQAIRLNEKAMVDINRKQMQAGKNYEGQTIGYYRSLSYANLKKSMGSKAPFRVPDLLLTGSFQDEMFMEVEDDQYFIYSNDDKAQMLKDRYKDNGNIFCINEENRPLAKAINTRTLSKLFTQATGIKG